MAYEYLLRNVSLFAAMSEDELNALAAEFVLQTFRRGQILFQQGSVTNSLYIVKSGSVQITSFGRGHEITFVDSFGPESYFGEFSLLDGLPRSGEAVAEENSEVLVLTRPTFFRFLENHPIVSLKLLVTVSRRMRFAESAVGHPALRSPEQKVAGLLLSIAGQYQTNTPDGIRLSVRLTSDDLSALAGVTRADASTVIGVLSRAGCLRLDRTHVISVDTEALRARLQEAAQSAQLPARV